MDPRVIEGERVVSSPLEPIKTAEINWVNEKPSLDLKRRTFIEGNQLIERWAKLSNDPSANFVIAETGFGNGLNFLLTWHLWQQHAPPSATLHYIASEPHPFEREDLATYLRFYPALEKQAQHLLSKYPTLTPGFHYLTFEKGRVNLILMLGDTLHCYRELLVCGDPNLEKKLRTYAIDAWFMDEFLSAHSLKWKEQLFATMDMLSKSTTTFAPDAIKAKANSQPIVPRSLKSTPWHASIHKPINDKTALIIGAGLAGCYLASALAHRHWKVILLDAENTIASGASGNQHAILYPKLSSFYSPLNAFMLTTYLFAIRAYKKLLKKDYFGELSGILQLAYNDKEQHIQDNLAAWLANYPELGRLVDAKEASTLAGINVHQGGLYMPHSGWIDSKALCATLINHPAIQVTMTTKATILNYDHGKWQVANHAATVAIIANGFQANTFEQTKHIPLKSIRGQMTSIAANQHSLTLARPLCAEAHIIPARHGLHGLGATYHSGITDDACTLEDDTRNLGKLSSLATEPIWSNEVKDHWAGIRAATPDYLPFVGPVTNALEFKQQFSGLSSNAKRWIPAASVVYEGLYLFAGFGSRGLTTIPLGAEWLAATINNEPSMLPRAMVQSLSPARFLRREIVRLLKS